MAINSIDLEGLFINIYSINIFEREEIKMMKVYFDCEFTGLTKNCDLISIGLVSETGQGFYAEFMDYDEDKILDKKWMNFNVINNLFLKANEEDFEIITRDRPYSIFFKRDDGYWIKNALLDWFNGLKESKLNRNEIQLYSDCSHFDFVLFLSLFGSALDLPEFISPVCHDINLDIANHLNIPESKAFDINRNRLADSFSFRDRLVENLKEVLNLKLKGLSRHNSFVDALEIARIERGIKYSS